MVLGSSVCSQASPAGLGRWQGKLEAEVVALQGGCASPGPVAYFAVDVSAAGDVAVDASALDFEPQVGVKFEHCDSDWALCVQGTTGWIPDVAAGTKLIVAVSAPLESIDPRRLESSPSEVDFTFGVRVRRVLEVGEPCGSHARCESGSQCTSPPENPTGPEICTPVPGDRCSAAFDVALEADVPRQEQPPVHPWPGDDHAHRCGGQGEAEWVYRLQFPASGAHALKISAQGSTTLAMRAPSCLPEDERMCGKGELRLEPLAWKGMESAFLFVESASDAPVVAFEWVEAQP